MNILSLFDGMSCGQIALERAGIDIDYYFSSEIDKYAIKITQKNYPNTIQLGNVIHWKDWNLPKIDLLMGGSPCQGFSIAGKRLNWDDPRSRLFFKYVDCLRWYKPKGFIFENVARMRKDVQDAISYELGVEPIRINSNLVSAQNRDRFYWTNIPDILQPEDKNIYLQDILEYGHVDKMKSYCIDASYFKGGNLKRYFENASRQLVFDKPIRVAHFGKGNQGQRVYATNAKSVSLNSVGGGWGAKTGLYAFTYSKKRGFSKLLEKSHPLQATDYKSGSKLNRNQNQTSIVDINDLVYRKLTPIECERLQTVEDNYTEGISNTQRYKMLGNGFTVDVIVHILNNI
jgi:DNA-cytosine methyltransferase